MRIPLQAVAEVEVVVARYRNAGVAQLEERLPRKQRVLGSTPSAGSIAPETTTGSPVATGSETPSAAGFVPNAVGAPRQGNVREDARPCAVGTEKPDRELESPPVSKPPKLSAWDRRYEKRPEQPKLTSNEFGDTEYEEEF